MEKKGAQRAFGASKKLFGALFDAEAKEKCCGRKDWAHTREKSKESWAYAPFICAAFSRLPLCLRCGGR